MNTFQSVRAFTKAALLIGSLISSVACKNTGPDPIGPGTGNPTPGPGKAGYVIGKVTDPQGKALPRATIYTNNTVFTGRGAEVSSTSDGSYQLQLVSGMGQWITKGYILKQYNNRVYKIELDPENPDSFTEEEKPVRNFQWKLTGHIADLSLDMYYGGTVETFRDPNANELRDNENIEFTFKPVGPLIDGSTGKTLTLRVKKRYDDFIKDVPMGRYAVTAIYKPTGQTLKVRDVFDNGDYAQSVTVDFTGRESATRANMMGIGYTDR